MVSNVHDTIIWRDAKWCVIIQHTGLFWRFVDEGDFLAKIEAMNECQQASRQRDAFKHEHTWQPRCYQPPRS